jgi:hypothetical protein
VASISLVWATVVKAAGTPSFTAQRLWEPLLIPVACLRAPAFHQVTTLLSKIDEEPEVAPPSPEELKALQDKASLVVLA